MQRVLITGAQGDPLTSAAALRAAGRFNVRLADGTVPAHVREEGADGRD